VTPALKAAHDVDLEMTPLFAVDQIAKAQASRGAPPFDAFVLDPGPRVTGIERGLFEKFDAKRLGNLARLPAGMTDEYGVTVAALRGRDVDIEFVKPESGAVAFFTTMHITRGSREQDNAYKYFDTVISAPVQSALMQPPNNFIPVNREVKLAANLPMASLDEMAKFVKHDWSKINPLRAGWIERFNKEVAK